MKISVVLLTILLFVAVAAVGARNIFRQSNVPAPGVGAEQNAALDEALQNGMISETDYQQVSKKLIVLKNGQKIDPKLDVHGDKDKIAKSNPPQP